MNVITADGQVFPAVLHSMDAWSDFAIVHIPDAVMGGKSGPWKPVRFGNAKSLRLGEWLFTFGHPLGLTHSLTAGIVSSLHRHNVDIDMSGKMDPSLEFIQTNFSGLDFGNSGGAVFNMNGEVIAVNVIKATTDGISFAARIDAINLIIQSLMTKGRMRRPWLGLRLLTLKPAVVRDIREAYALDRALEAISAAEAAPTPDEERPSGISSLMPAWLSKNEATKETSNQHQDVVQHPDDGLLHLFDAGHTRGLLVVSVFDHSPASKVGMRRGDIVTHVNGNPIRNTKRFFDLVGDAIQEPVSLTLCRAQDGGDVMTLEVKITPEELDLFAENAAPLNMGDHQASYEAYLRSLDKEKRDKLRFLE